MSRFPVPSDESRRQELRALYREMGVEEGGAPSNFFTGIALRPDLLRGAWALTRSVYEGLLSKELREMVQAYVSARNEAHYCCLTHALNLRKLGVPEDWIHSVVSDPDLASLPSPYPEVLRFALKVSKSPNSLEEGDFQALRGLGYSDEELLEVVMTVAYAKWSNTWSAAADILVDRRD